MYISLPSGFSLLSFFWDLCFCPLVFSLFGFCSGSGPGLFSEGGFITCIHRFLRFRFVLLFLVFTLCSTAILGCLLCSQLSLKVQAVRLGLGCGRSTVGTCRLHTSTPLLIQLRIQPTQAPDFDLPSTPLYPELQPDRAEQPRATTHNPRNYLASTLRHCSLLSLSLFSFRFASYSFTTITIRGYAHSLPPNTRMVFVKSRIATFAFALVNPPRI